MYTIGYVGNKKLTHEELERIVRNMQSTKSNIQPQNKRRQFIPVVDHVTKKTLQRSKT